MRILNALAIGCVVSIALTAPVAVKANTWPTPDEVFAEICKNEILYPEIVMRQALLETGNLKSPFLMNKNNLFGFRTKAYLSYPTWQDSVSYYKRWQDRRYTNKNEDYFSFLHRIKYASGDYKKHVMSIKWNKSCPK